MRPPITANRNLQGGGGLMAADNVFDSLYVKELTLGGKTENTTRIVGNNNTDSINFVVTADGSGSVRVFDSSGTRNGYLKGDALMVGGASANALSIAQFDSTTKFFLPPRMTTSQETTLSAAIVSAGIAVSGAMIFNTTKQKLRVWGDGGVTGFVDQT